MKTLTTTILFTLCFSSILMSQKKKSDLNIESILVKSAESFVKKNNDSFVDTLNFNVKESDKFFYIVFSNGKYEMFSEENPNAKLTFTADLETYKKLFLGELSPITAIGRASIMDPAPLDVMLGNGMTINKLDFSWIYYTVNNFFNVDPNNKIIIDNNNTRNVHSGNVIGLYYNVGYRSAYYFIKKGETLNESGEKNPFHQSFIILNGSGFAKIGDSIIEIKANEAYYIRPNVEHKVWTDNENGISLIWNAWGEKSW